eukprot:1820591-Pleurochrysis_carterae.AAC.1
MGNLIEVDHVAQDVASKESTRAHNGGCPIHDGRPVQSDGEASGQRRGGAVRTKPNQIGGRAEGSIERGEDRSRVGEQVAITLRLWHASGRRDLATLRVGSKRATTQVETAAITAYARKLKLAFDAQLATAPLHMRTSTAFSPEPSESWAAYTASAITTSALNATLSPRTEQSDFSSRLGAAGELGAATGGP